MALPHIPPEILEEIHANPHRNYCYTKVGNPLLPQNLIGRNYINASAYIAIYSPPTETIIRLRLVTSTETTWWDNTLPQTTTLGSYTLTYKVFSGGIDHQYYYDQPCTYNAITRIVLLNSNPTPPSNPHPPPPYTRSFIYGC